MSDARRQVLVIGGGITGLACAHRILERAGENAPRVVVLEATARPGGVIRTERVDGCLLEGGPDTLVAHKPWGLALCGRLGLEDELVEPRRTGTQIVRGRRLVPLPDGFGMIAPTRPGPFLRSPLLSPAGKLRALAEPWVPARDSRDGDESVGAFVRRRFGGELLERVAEPLLGGLFLADVDRLSVHATLPHVAALEERHGSVLRGMRNGRRPARVARVARVASGGRPGRGCGFATLRDGLGRLVERLVESMPAGALRTAATVLGVAPDGTGGGWRVALESGETLQAGAVVLACPSHAAGRLLRTIDRELAAELERLHYAPCATVSLLYREPDLRRPASGSGFFVPRGAGSPLVAASFVSAKFPERAPAGHLLVRTFVGGAVRDDLTHVDDACLAATVHGELRPYLGAEREPVFSKVYRYDRAMPQLEVGFPERLARIHERLAERPGLFLAGGATGAVGIPDCVHSGETIAERVVERLRAAGTPEPALVAAR